MAITTRRILHAVCFVLLVGQLDNLLPSKHRSLSATHAQQMPVFFVGGFVEDAAKAYLAFATALGAGSGSRRAVFVDGVSEFLGTGCPRRAPACVDLNNSDVLLLFA